MEVGHAFKGEPVVQELPQDYGEAVGIHLVVVVLLLPVPQSDRAVQLPKKKKKKIMMIIIIIVIVIIIVVVVDNILVSIYS